MSKLCPLHSTTMMSENLKLKQSQYGIVRILIVSRTLMINKIIIFLKSEISFEFETVSVNFKICFCCCLKTLFGM